MSVPSVFTRPRRQIQQTFGQAHAEQIVKSADELLTAITRIASSTNISALSTIGSSIVIAAPISVDRTIIIPNTCPALTIRASARVPIKPTAVIAALFEVQAELVTIRDLFVYGDASGYATTFVQTPATFSAGRSAEWLNVRDNVVFCDRIYVDQSTSQAAEARIVNNDQNEINGSHGVAVVINSSGAVVQGNALKNGGGDVITVAASGEYAYISGNECGLGNVTTSASLGKNTITGNRRITTLTAHATDDTLGGNT